MTELVPTSTVAVALRKAKTSVAEVMRAVDGEQQKVSVAPATTPIPKPTALPDAATSGYFDVPTMLTTLSLPTTRRQLTDTELVDVTTATVQVKAAQAALENALNQLKAAAFNHFDAVAAERGKITPETHLTKEGWAVIEDKDSAVVKGLAQKLVREVSGGTPELTELGLHDLEQDDKINHDDYLAMTRQVRVVDEPAVLDWMRRNPDKITTLATAITPKSAPSARFVVRDNT